MNIILTPEQAQFIQQELETVHYASVHNLFFAALNLLAQQRDDNQSHQSPSEPSHVQHQLLDRIQQRRQQRPSCYGNIDSTTMLREDDSVKPSRSRFRTVF